MELLGNQFSRKSFVINTFPQLIFFLFFSEHLKPLRRTNTGLARPLVQMCATCCVVFMRFTLMVSRFTH